MHTLSALLIAASGLTTLANPGAVDDLIARASLPDAAVLEEVKACLHARVPPLVVPDSRDAWEVQASELRRRFLDEVVMKGVPASWREGDVKIDYVADIETGHGYRIRKLRYEAIPGMWIPALLYEPDGAGAGLPGALNVNGHYDEGKVRDEEQIRCINLAKRGVVNIHPEWFRCGELGGADYDHGRSAYLDAVGIRGVSVFYLALERALDILESHPRVDPTRLAMTGLSGGGWQTAVFSALDERVSAIVPVAGHGAMGVRIDHGSDMGDLEQVPIDMLTVADYTHLTALFAPRPSLLIYNAQDECCFVAARTLPAIYDPVVPVYALYGAAGGFRFHVNEDPGDHNYGQDNRIQFYNFVNEFLVPEADWGGVELPTEGEILPVEQTNVGLPEDNVTIVGKALEVAQAITRPIPPARESGAFGPWARAHRTKLRDLLNFTPINLHTVTSDMETRDGSLYTAYHFRNPDWTIAAAGIFPPDANGAELHLVMDDGGFPGAREKLAALATEGKHAVAMAPLFQNGNSPRSGNTWQYAMALNATGERALAVQAAQLAAVCDWFRTAKGIRSIAVHTRGNESGLIALTAAALNPGLISATDTAEMAKSLVDIMESRGKYSESPSLYNFGFLIEFDFDIVRAMGS